MAYSKTRKDIVKTAERRAFVFELRKSGASYRQIAEATEKKYTINALPGGWGERYAHKDVKRELSRLRAEIFENATEIVRLDLERMDMMLMIMVGQMKDKKTSDKIKQGAAEKILKIMKRRADMMGLDAPTHLKIDDWRSELVQMIRENTMSHSQIVANFGDANLADQLFLEAGVSSSIKVVDKNIIDAQFTEVKAIDDNSEA